MKLLTGGEMQSLDRKTIELGIPGIVLMENAGRGVAELAREMVPEAGKKIIIFCGSGNNGGDGFVAARYLANWGYEVQVLIFGKGFFSSELAQNLRVLENLYIDTLFIRDRGMLEAYRDKDYDLVIDALLGTGLVNEVKGLMADAIKFINSLDRPVLSVDIPSGIDSDSGMVLGLAVQAQRTITFAMAKVGNLVSPGHLYNGQLKILDIGMPTRLTTRAQVHGEALTLDWVKENLPPRSSQAHKGVCGKILVIGGCQGMVGAPILATKAALTAGAGLVFTGIPAPLQGVLNTSLLEAIALPLPLDDTGHLGFEALDLVLKEMDSFNVVILGPGLGRSTYMNDFVKKIIMECSRPIILDADGLNAVTIDDLRRRKAEIVLTPHYGEMARLMRIPTEMVVAGPLMSARSLAKELGANIVLKGPHSLVVLPNEDFMVNTSGNPGMATAGSGDVLAGIIAGLAGQMDNIAKASALGTFIHGLAGDLAQREKTNYGLLASDIIGFLPQAFQVLQEGWSQ